MTLTCITFFSGGGLADIGYEQAGFKVLAGVELCPRISEYHKKNLPDCELMVGGVELFPSDRYRGVDLLHLSPPCQRYSGVNRFAKGIQYPVDPTYMAISHIKKMKPKYVVLENVTAFQNTTVFRFFQQQMWNMGYKESTAKVMFSQYLVPQTRKRLISLWSSKGRVELPLTVGTIGWLEALEGLEEHFDVVEPPEYLLKYLDPDLRKILEGSYYTEPLMFDKTGYRPRTAKNYMTAILGARPGFTILARNPLQLSVYIDCKYKLVSLAGYARLQTMPKSYILPRTRWLSKKIIGNGVPCAYTKVLGEHLIRNATA